MRPRPRRSARAVVSTQVVRDEQVRALAKKCFAARFQFVDRLIAIVAQYLRARGVELEGNRMLVCLHVEHVYFTGQPDRLRHRAIRQVSGGREQRIAEMNLRGKIEFIAASLAGIAAAEPRQSLRIGDYSL